MDCDCNRMDCPNCYQINVHKNNNTSQIESTSIVYGELQNLNRTVKINLVYFSLNSVRIATNSNGEIPVPRKPYVQYIYFFILKIIIYLNLYWLLIKYKRNITIKSAEFDSNYCLVDIIKVVQENYPQLKTNGYNYGFFKCKETVNGES